MGSDILDSNQLAAGGVCRIIHSPIKESRHAIVCQLKATAFIIFVAGWIAMTLLLTPNVGDFIPIRCMLSWLILTPFALVYLITINAVLKNEFVLKQNHLKLPSAYWIATGGRLRWNWSHLRRVVFARSSYQSEMPNQLVLYFAKKERGREFAVAIKHEDISEVDLKKLVYAIVNNAPLAEFEPPLADVQLVFPTVSGIKHLNFHSFTSLWDEEFSSRYSATLFVPLAAGAELQSGAIRIVELIACGGSAAIYSAQTREGTNVVIKEAVVPKNADAKLKAKALEMFDREALLLSRLEHPNIAKVLDYFIENEHHYEVIQYIDGMDLRRFVKDRGPQPEEFVLNWARQICEILVYLHSQEPPIVHRDLTPDNLVLSVEVGLVLIDFGAANAFIGTATGTMVGKQSYMPPEQLRGKSVPQSDIYALGCTLHFLLTGSDPMPLEVANPGENILVSQDLNLLIMKCTAQKVENRFSSAQEVLEHITAMRRDRAGR